MRRGIAAAAALLALAVVMAGLSAAPALAAPSFTVTLQRDEGAFPVVHHSDERVDLTAEVENSGADPTSGTVELEIDLPAGQETFPFKVVDPAAEGQPPNGWSCSGFPAAGAQSARVLCERSDALAPGAKYPGVKVIVGLGADAPDLAVATATASGGGAASASDELTFPIAPALPFGIFRFTAALLDAEGHDYTQAGGHADHGESEVVFNWKRALSTGETLPYFPVQQVRQVVVDLPRGVGGNALALPELCPEIELVRKRTCPPGSVVGGIFVLLPGISAKFPIYAIEPEFGSPAEFAFSETGENVFTFSPRLRAEDGYAISFELAPAPQVNLLESTVTLCDFGGVQVGKEFGSCKKKGAVGSNPKPLFTNPTRCGVPLTTRIRANSWLNPTFVEGPPFANATITGCEKVPFEPQVDLQPTSHLADSPSGLDVELSLPTNGLEGKDDEGKPDPEAVAQSTLREAKITFPEGMAVDASAGHGLGACSAEQIKLGTNDPITCPDSSKIGTVEIDTPVIEDTLKGAVYVARQGDVEGSLLGLYLVFDSPKNGILIKQAAKVTPDPQTGRLTTTVAEIPEQPFSAVHMHFPGGPRAALLTPPKCGTYGIEAELVPWSGGAPVTRTSSFNVTQGPGGGACPSGTLDAKLDARSQRALAGKPSPFALRLSREDGSGRFTGLDLTTPPGETAYLKGIPYCPQSAIDAAKAREREGLAILEANDPSCPAASQVGVASVGAGAGPEPLFVNTGRAYLAGPYKGAPVSLVLVAPALAGPLDLGTVVVQTALNVNPETAQVSAVSDAIPTILHGLLVDVRDIQVTLNRPHFTLNPTDCDPLAVNAVVRGEGGATEQLSNRFQVGGCDKLSFKPKLGVRLIGGTRRGGHPRLRGTLQAGPGEANIGRAAVTIPRSEFLDQAHIRTICTRVQFAANACPKGSVYGHAKATTPLLDYPVEGPVFLRSSSHKLPDLVVDLHGPDWQPIEAEVVGRIDSIRGQIRTTFENAPDVPLTKFVLSMRGGKKGLLVNSRNVCATANRATVALTAHDDAEFTSRPAVKNGKCK